MKQKNFAKYFGMISLLLIAVFFIVGCNINKINSRCDYNNKNISYAEKNQEVCSTIDILCKYPNEVFYDNCGCGCKLIPNSINFKVLMKSYGGNSTEKGYSVIKNEQNYFKILYKVGLITGPGGPAFVDIKYIPVDFSKDYLIAVLQGQKNNAGYEIAVKKIIDDDDKITVYVEESSPSTNCNVTMSSMAFTTSPYSIVKIAKIDKKIIFKTDYIVHECIHGIYEVT